MGHSNYGMAPTKCIPAVIKFVMSRKQNAGRSHFMKTDNRSFERVGEFKCLGTTLTLRRLMSYIYGAPILDVSRSHTTTHHSR